MKMTIEVQQIILEAHNQH